MSGVLIYLILFAIIIFRLKNQGKNKGGGRNASAAGQRGSAAANRRTSRRSPMASDGHRVPKNQDISCRQYGHNHEEFDTPRFIPHEDPEDGFIILNGVKMRLSEADKYEDRI
ncbi:MAG: hypothetical protein Q4F43_07410 [Eubacteriales bacterium]|nr:hypothetical protein [Eubacteriales bacterium]